jgi:FKBP12-rapamycin complex-associated protein
VRECHGEIVHNNMYGTHVLVNRISQRVLRDNKESLMAVLEAFVYDPLINWRLLAPAAAVAAGACG